jgi:hypothetical protein
MSLTLLPPLPLPLLVLRLLRAGCTITCRLGAAAFLLLLLVLLLLLLLGACCSATWSVVGPAALKVWV